jgi:hypothetical protein
VARPTKPESKLSEAADKATAMLQGLQSRLNQAGSREEISDDLDRELREYFITEPADVTVPNDLQDRVIDAVANRILDIWERSDRHELGEVENKVIDRLAQRILERMTRR